MGIMLSLGEPQFSSPFKYALFRCLSGTKDVQTVCSGTGPTLKRCLLALGLMIKNIWFTCEVKLSVTVIVVLSRKDRTSESNKILDIGQNREECPGRVKGEPRLRSTAWKRKNCLTSVHFHLCLFIYSSIVGHYTTVFLCLYGGGGNTLPAFIAASDKYSWFSATAGRMRPFCR